MVAVPNSKFAVLVADHDILTSRLLAARLRKHRLFEVSECCGSPADVLAAVARDLPAVLLLSPVLREAPDGGFQVLRTLRKSSPSVRGILLLDLPDQRLVIEAFRCGAKGIFVRSDYEFGALCKCVSRVREGQIWANSEQLEFLLEAFVSGGAARPSTHANGSLLVSRRERDIVKLAIEGLSNREIASQLGLSEHTVKNYIFRIFDKLGVSSRVELVHYAIAHPDIAAAAPQTTEVPKRKQLVRAVAS